VIENPAKHTQAREGTYLAAMLFEFATLGMPRTRSGSSMRRRSLLEGIAATGSSTQEEG
jgi:hypothetical protein